MGQGGAVRTGVGATASAVPPTPSYSPDPLLLRILPLGRGSEDRVCGGGWLGRLPLLSPATPYAPNLFPLSILPYWAFLAQTQQK